MKMMGFEDRFHAGKLLASKLEELAPFLINPIILALPRGGIEVGFEISKRLQIPLGVFIVRKIGAPGNPEFGIGALAESGHISLSSFAKGLEKHVQRTIETERKRIEHYKKVFRLGDPPPELAGRSVILCDDGVATGLTFKCALEAIRQMEPHEVIAAIPVAPMETAEELSKLADKLLVLETPITFFAVSQFYRLFPENDDAYYQRLLGLEQPTSLS